MLIAACIVLHSRSIFSHSFSGKLFIYFSSSFRAHLVHLSGHVNHAAAQHVFYGPTAREGGVRDVLPGSCALPQLLLALSHRLLPLWEGVSHLLQVSPRRRACMHADWPGRSRDHVAQLWSFAAVNVALFNNTNAKKKKRLRIDSTAQ